MRKSVKQASAFLLGVLAISSASSQSMNSPYSIYGIGDIEASPYNRTSGMGGTGLALSSSFLITDNNVASLTGLTKSFFVVSLNGAAKMSRYSGDPVNAGNSSNRDLWIKSGSVFAKMNTHWASGIGFKQFSNVNYKLAGSRLIEGTGESYDTYYEGDGGLNDYYWSNAFSFGKKFSFGVKSSLLAGAINQTETLNSDNLSTTIVTQQQDYYSRFRLETGALYRATLSKNWEVSLGARYSPSVRLSTERAISISENNAIIIDDKVTERGEFALPRSVGFGFAFIRNKQVTWAADYNWQDWASVKARGPGWQYKNAHRVSLGVESAKENAQWGRLGQMKFVQFGAFYEQSGLVVRNEPINQFGVTAGFGKQLRNGISYSLSGEVGQRGTTRNNLIRENYFKIGFNLSYRDFLMGNKTRYF